MCVARHWGRRGAHLSKKKSAMIECKKQCQFQRFVMSIVASIRSLRSMDRSFQARSFHLILHPVITGAQPKAGTGHKMQTVSFFQRYIVRDISLTEIYRWLIEILSAILKSTRHGGQSRKIIAF